MADIKIGQVYREKDSRFVRYVRIDSFATKNGQPAAWCLACSSAGKPNPYAGRATRIKTANLQKRFELITELAEKL